MASREWLSRGLRRTIFASIPPAGSLPSIEWWCDLEGGPCPELLKWICVDWRLLFGGRWCRGDGGDPALPEPPPPPLAPTPTPAPAPVRLADSSGNA